MKRIRQGYRVEHVNVRFLSFKYNHIVVDISLSEQDKVYTKIYQSGKLICDLPYAVWFDLTSKEDILHKLKLLLTYY